MKPCAAWNLCRTMILTWAVFHSRVAIAAPIDQATAAYEVRPAVINGGGRGDLLSASYRLANGLSEIGIASHDSPSYRLLPSFTWTFHRPEAVADLSAQTLGTSSASLHWSAPALDGHWGDLTQDIRYFIQYSTFSAAAWYFENAQIVLSTSGVASQEAQSRIVQGLAPSATVYFRLWTVDMHAGLSEASNVASTTLPTAAPSVVDDLHPAYVPGFSAQRSSDGAQVHLSWSVVTMNADKTTINDLWGYRILRSSSMGGPATMIAEIPAPATSYAHAAGQDMYYYQIVAMDLSGNLGPLSQTVTGESSWRSMFGGDSAMSVLKHSTARRLLAGNNSSARDLRVVLTRRKEHEAGNIVRSFFVDLVDAQSAEPVSPEVFGGESLDLMFSYGASTTVAQSTLGALAQAGSMALYYDNGSGFIPIAGLHDTGTQTLSMTTPNFGSYQIRQAPAAAGGDFALISVRPRIITPNGDGRNDKAFFFFENPKGSPVRLRIIDVNGGHVANVTQAGPSAGTSLVWDARDDWGRKVPSGAYVYILEADAKRFDGTVVVAR